MTRCTKEQPIVYNYSEKLQPKQSAHPRHMHAEYEILLFMAGGPSYVVDGRKYSPTAYTLLLVPPNSYHFALIEDAAVYHRYLLDFRGEALDQTLLREAFPKQGCCWQLSKDHSIVQAFERLDALWGKNPEHRNVLLQSFCTQILLELLALGQPEGDVPRQTYPVLTYIDKHLTTIRSADEIAGAFYISTSALLHQFSEKMGISLMKYIRQKRLLLAKHLIEKGGKPTNVYCKCGFADYTTFYKAYVRYFGTAPSKTETNQPER